MDPGEKWKVPGEICWSLKKVPGKMRKGLGKWLQASFLDGGKGIMGEWVGKRRSSTHLPKVGEIWAAETLFGCWTRAKKICFRFQEKVCWCLCFFLKMSIQKTENKFYTLMKGFFSSGTAEILELRAINSENKENRILHFSMIQSTVCWEVHLWQIRGGEYEVTAIWLNTWKQHRIRR